jgi:hypothetical protein
MHIHAAVMESYPPPKIRTTNYTQSKSQGPGVFTLCGDLFSCYIPSCISYLKSCSTYFICFNTSSFMVVSYVNFQFLMLNVNMDIFPKIKSKSYGCFSFSKKLRFAYCNKYVCKVS